MNRCAGYGLEIPVIYRFYGPKCYCDKLKELLNKVEKEANFLKKIIFQFFGILTSYYNHYKLVCNILKNTRNRHYCPKY